MSDPRTLARLAELQRRFGAVLRTPLDRSTGTLRAAAASYAPALCAAVAVGGAPGRERLAVYNRQYWFRLFGVVHHELRLTTALAGAWAMNELAARFFTERPPRGHDLARAVDGFDAFLAGAVPAAGLAVPGGAAVPRDAILDAARIDAAHRALFAALEEPPLRLTPADAERLPAARLRWSAACALVEERWPLVNLYRELPAQLGDRRWPLPLPHAGGARAWLICRAGAGHRAIPLAPRHARLLELLRRHAVAEALALLEAEAAGDRDLGANAQRWLAEGMRLGLWTALEDA